MDILSLRKKKFSKVSCRVIPYSQSSSELMFENSHLTIAVAVCCNRGCDEVCCKVSCVVISYGQLSSELTFENVHLKRTFAVCCSRYVAAVVATKCVAAGMLQQWLRRCMLQSQLCCEFV